ncbi:hypothetical protein [Hyphococcus sp.]|uniref:hypothetical protein n=1 Tax=Hyphococcus sp. TaxID=2038636 RepID=UPI003CCB9D62
MHGIRQILAVLTGLCGFILLGGGVALSNAVGDFALADAELRQFLAMLFDTNEAAAFAEKGAAIMFLAGVTLAGLAWWMWPQSPRQE